MVQGASDVAPCHELRAVWAFREYTSAVKKSVSKPQFLSGFVSEGIEAWRERLAFEAFTLNKIISLGDIILQIHAEM